MKLLLEFSSFMLVSVIFFSFFEKCKAQPGPQTTAILVLGVVVPAITITACVYAVCTCCLHVPNDTTAATTSVMAVNIFIPQAQPSTYHQDVTLNYSAVSPRLNMAPLDVDTQLKYTVVHRSGTTPSTISICRVILQNLYTVHQLHLWLHKHHSITLHKVTAIPTPHRGTMIPH